LHYLSAVLGSMLLSPIDELADCHAGCREQQEHGEQ
jgi:hypothetical protein